MKKKLLFLAAFAVVVAVTMGTICSKRAVKASNDNRDNDLISYKATYKDSTTKWNNNDGRNFQVVANESNVKNIQYEIDWLAGSNGVDANGDVVLHYGINGWDDVQDVKMDIKMQSDYDGQTWYKAIITVEEGSTINYCIKANTSEGEKWDNNNGDNYSVIANQDCNQ